QVYSSRLAIANVDLDEMAGRNSSEYMVERNRMLISWKSSSLLRWEIASVTDLNSLYGNVSGMRNLFLTITLLLLIAIISLAIVSGRQLYMPVSRLLHFINSDHQTASGAGRKQSANRETTKQMQGEFQVISERLATLQSRLRESLPAHQEKFIRSLLKKRTYRVEAVEERFDFLGIDLQTEGIGLILVSIEEDGRGEISAETEKLEQLLIVDTIDSAIDSRFTRWVNEHTERMFLALVNCGENGISAVFAVAEAIKNGMQTNHGMACTFGIGSYCRTIEDLPQAYAEAKEALTYRNMSGDSEVIYIEDVRLQSYMQLPYPKNKEFSLLISIKNGDTKQALDVFADMVSDMRGKASKVAFSQVQQAFLLLLARLIELVGELRLDMKEIVPDERPQLLAAFLEKNDWQEMTEWFEYLISACTAYIGDAFREKKNMHVERVQQIVANKYGETVSLAAVAEMLNLNPTYLSRIFKEHMNVTFTEYLTQVRIAKSKELLMQPELKIQDISKRLDISKWIIILSCLKKRQE
ncbi:MAG: helix-turn-helix domain-containing protein, partial [Cohnella sp.]|nr:helix-turn-helix domain-containing protein [Cohnella sp.]